MCISEDSLLQEPTDSTVASSDSSDASDDHDWNDASPARLTPKLKRLSTSLSEGSSFYETSSTAFSLVKVCLAGLASAAGMVAFSLWLPFALAPHAASKTYHWAFYSYDPKLSVFDNTAWTYCTDYALAVVMAVLASTILRYSKNPLTCSLCWRSASLLLGYAASVSAGALAHQYYLTVEDRNTWGFQFLWTICVGTVTAASTAMGLSGSQVVQQFQEISSPKSRLHRLSVVHDTFWWAFGGLVTIVCIAGGMSFQRPACDIFIAGITQTPSSFYMMLLFGLVNHPHVKMWARIMGIVAFILNAPLLPMYPLLVQYTDWSLATINTLLHCWLCVAWSMQGISMRHMIRALTLHQQEQLKSRKSSWGTILVLYP